MVSRRANENSIKAKGSNFNESCKCQASKCSLPTPFAFCLSAAVDIAPAVYICDMHALICFYCRPQSVVG